MTDMKLAVVPVYELSDIDTSHRAAKRHGWTHYAQGMMLQSGGNAGKLTREQIETMARAVAKELGEDFDNLGDDENIGWSKNHCRQLVVAAVRSVGFGVEG